MIYDRPLHTRTSLTLRQNGRTTDRRRDKAWRRRGQLAGRRRTLTSAEGQSSIRTTHWRDYLVVHAQYRLDLADVDGAAPE